MKFRKKPVVIEAMQLTEKNGEAIVEWIRSNVGICAPHSDYSGIEISTLEGSMMAYPGDWIIRGIKGEFYPCKPDIFEATYDPVSDGPFANPAIAERLL